MLFKLTIFIAVSIAAAISSKSSLDAYLVKLEAKMDRMVTANEKCQDCHDLAPMFEKEKAECCKDCTGTCVDVHNMPTPCNCPVQA